MKNFKQKIAIFLAGAILSAGLVATFAAPFAQAISVQWDRPAAGRINPLNILDTIYGNQFIGTSTSLPSTFPHATSTLLSVLNKLFVGGTSTTTIDSTGAIVVPSAGSITSSGLGTPAGTLVAADPNGKLIATSTPVGTITSVTNADGSLTISPTTGAVVSSINLGHTNIWTILQRFVMASTSMESIFSKLYVGGTSTTTIDSTGAIVVPSAGSVTISGLAAAAGTFVAADATGKLIATTSPSGGGGSSAFPFTPTNNFGINTNATSTKISFFAGLYASSTSRIASTTFDIGGNVGISSSTPWAPFSMYPVINPLFNNLVQSSSSIYSSAGTYTWVPPAGAAYVIVQAWGGGGGGGGATNGPSRGGAGGGGAAYVASTTVTLSPLTTSVTVIVGQGGRGGQTAANGAGGTGFAAGGAGSGNTNAGGGGGGGSSAFGSSVIACGGGGGSGVDATGNNSGNPGTGATGTTGGTGGASGGAGSGAGGGGACNTAGSSATPGTGGTAQTGTNGSGGNIAGGGSGGGGSSAGVSGNGNAGTGGTPGLGGAGSGGATAGSNGVGPNSGGGGNGGSSSAGGNGGNPGAGGGASSLTTSTAGNGGDGMVIITTFSYTNLFTPLFAQMFSTQEPVFVGGVNQNGSTTIGIGTSTPKATLDIYSSTNPFGAMMIHIVQSGIRYIAEEIDSVGHLITGGKAPTCGTGCSSVTGDDRSMRMVTGSSVSSATINFANTYTTTPVCIANEESAGVVSVDASSTPSAVIVDFATSLTSVRVAVICQISTNFTF